ncbi:GntR family transcriptional regulator [Actinacidiphila glaucinigra]|uniref:GntR family transcriptional regulator n=1 Tax=Actinacidiphila glaucinigra TaxID=235986 RepID=UPI0036716619
MDWQPNESRWRQVYALMEERIADGTYPPGGRLPSLMELQQEFGIAVATGQKVLRQLRDDGLAVMYPGLGTFVTELPKP